MPRSKHSRFEYDDVSTLTTFNLDGPPAEPDNESVLSKLFLKVKSAVSGPTPVVGSPGASISSISTSDSLNKQLSNIMIVHTSLIWRRTIPFYKQLVNWFCFFQRSNWPRHSKVSEPGICNESDSDDDFLLEPNLVRITSPTLQPRVGPHWTS